MSALTTSPNRSTTHIPILFGAIERPRLLTLLERNWLHKVTLVTAPSGYGKTTLVAQFARANKSPIVWYTLSPMDRDAINLQNHVISALKEIFPNLEDFHQPAGASTRERAILLAKCLEQVQQDTVIVLDDLHLLDNAQVAEIWLRSLIEFLPKQCHLMLLSRTILKLSLLQNLTRGEVWGIGEEDLRFDEAELRDLEQSHNQIADPT